MKHTFGLVCLLTVIALSPDARAQSPASPRHIVGTWTSRMSHIDAATRMMTDTFTLTFQNGDGGPMYTIDFIARHEAQQPVASPGVVDIVVTQHPAEDDVPEMNLRVDGQAVPLVTRLRSRRSVVATVSLDELDRIASAGVVVDRMFNTELELGQGQVKMLRSTADRWLGRAQP
jgi:hypothetical protein